MKKISLGLLVLFGLTAQAQSGIQKSEVTRIETELSSDAMEGRALFTPGIEKASVFIEGEFKRIGLTYYKELQSYRQDFLIEGKKANNVITIFTSATSSNNGNAVLA